MRLWIAAALLAVACGPARDDRDDPIVVTKKDGGTTVVTDGGTAPDAGTCTGETDEVLCARQGWVCGTPVIVDRCGAMRSPICGSCGSGIACNGGKCGGTCVPETDLAMCRRLARDCGPVTAFDNCESSRVIPSCGECTNGGSCGVTTPGRCCVRETDAQLCASAGASCGVVVVQNGCGETREAVCDACGAGMTCESNRCSGWEKVASPVTQKLYEMAGSGPNDVWAAGDFGTVIHWNGTAWTTVAAPSISPINALWAFSPTDVWAASNNRKIWHYTGASWTEVTNPASLTGHVGGFWASSPTSIWGVGLAGTILFGNGSSFSAVTGPVATDYFSVFGTAANEIWAVDRGGTIARYDGSAWTQTLSGVPGTFTDVWASHARNVLAVGFNSTNTAGILYRWDGTSWTDLSLTEALGRLQTIWGLSGTDVFAAGNDGLIQHWDGHAISQQQSGVSVRLNAAWGASAASMWIVGDGGTILRLRR